MRILIVDDEENIRRIMIVVFKLLQRGGAIFNAHRFVPYRFEYDNHYPANIFLVVNDQYSHRATCL